MLDWFLALSLIAKLWLIYLAAGAALLAGATVMEITVSSKVDGAGGWMLFAVLMVMGVYGLPVMLLLSAAIWLVGLFW